MYEVLLKSFAEGAKRLAERLKNIPAEAKDFKRNINEWSIHEIIIHLADSEVNGWVRFRKLLAENGSEIMPYDQDRWCRELNYKEQNEETAIELFTLMRQLNTSLLKQVDDSKWNTHAIVHKERGSITLVDLVRIYDEHVDSHLAQIERMLEAWRLEHMAMKN